MSNRMVFVIGIALAVFCVLPAQAQIGKLGIGVHGTMTPEATDEENRTYSFGAHVRARISDTLGLEAAIDYRSEETDAYSLTLYPMQFSLLYYLLPSSRLSIYALFGIGITRSTISGDFFAEDATDTARSYHWGGGLEIPISDSFTIYGDARWLDLDLNFGSVLSADVKSSGWTWGGGITVYF